LLNLQAVNLGYRIKMGFDWRYFNSASISSENTMKGEHYSVIKPSHINGSPVVLNFIVRTKDDLKKSRNKAYNLLVP